MPWLALLQAFGSSVWSFLSSRFGQICIAFAVAWVWSGSNTNARWEAVIAAEKQAAEIAYQKEIARQAQVSQEIAAAATQRAEDDAELEKALRAQIEDLKNSERVNVQPHTLTRDKSTNCNIDDDLARRMQRLDEKARKAAPSRAARKVR